MSKSETLIHGDFHTSNIFADDTHLKVIDMEYTFGAPFSYDLGFIIANIISQACSAAFRPFDTESLNIRLQMAIKKAWHLIFYENALGSLPA